MITETEHTDGFPFQPSASLEEQQIARVYAEALMDAAEKNAAIEDIKGELHELVHEVFRQQPDFETFLSSGIISRDNKALVLENVFKDKASELFLSFLMVLAEHDRLGIVRTVEAEFTKLDDERHHRMPILVTTAVPLTDDQSNRLQEDLRSKFQLEPVLFSRVDPSILGGLVIRMGDWVLDHSVRSQITNIGKTLLTRGNNEIQSGRDRFSSD